MTSTLQLRRRICWVGDAPTCSIGGMANVWAHSVTAVNWFPLGGPVAFCALVDDYGARTVCREEDCSSKDGQGGCVHFPPSGTMLGVEIVSPDEQPGVVMERYCARELERYCARELALAAGTADESMSPFPPWLWARPCSMSPSSVERGRVAGHSAKNKRLLVWHSGSMYTLIVYNYDASASPFEGPGDIVQENRKKHRN